MATANYVLLQRITVTDPVASITFSSIPQTGYTDLKIVGSVRNSQGIANTILASFNGSTTNFSTRFIEGDGSSAYSSTNTRWIASSGDTTSTYSNWEVYIPNYTSSNYKSWTTDSVTELNGTTAYTTFIAGLWSDTSAINSITFTQNGSNMREGSSFSLYGIADANITPKTSPKAFGGDIVKTDGTYWYRVFTASGTFKPQVNLTCDYLVVAGGGGSGRGNGTSGGGGAGGLRSTLTATGGGGSVESALSLASGTLYSVAVGAGGAGRSDYYGFNGNNSSFSTIVSIGGGGSGGADPNQNGRAGGSGGGGGEQYGIYGTGGAGTANQGYAGAQGGGSPYRSGGGGGAGAAASSSNANGGAGVQLTVWSTPTGTGASGYYAGGGGAGATTGGTGGAGGGGTGSSSGSGITAGTASTGGGGGGAYVGNGSNGGSGIVIVRYAV
jgi:hypothetical protein